MKKIRIKDLFASKKKPIRLSNATLNGKKVSLRKLQVKDAVYFHDTYEELRDTMYLPYNKFNSIDDYTMYLIDHNAKYEKGLAVGWAIESTKTSEFVGVIQVYKFVEKEGRCSLSFYTVKGLKDPYIIESINLVIQYLFSTKLVRRIEVKIDSNDSFTEIALIKCGFAYEGSKRKYSYYGGEYHDVKVYAILDDEIVLTKEN